MSEIIIFEHSTLKYNIIYWLHDALPIFLLILVHPCDKPNKGGCGQICNKRKEWHVCSCKTGFVLGRDNKTCNKGEWINNSTLRIYVQLDTSGYIPIIINVIYIDYFSLQYILVIQLAMLAAVKFAIRRNKSTNVLVKRDMY